MKLETFFEKFEQFADAPNAVAKMRELVSQLAVQGKLTEQKQDDGGAFQLLASIEREREALASKLRIPEGYLPNEEIDPLFQIPANWSWSKLGAIALQIQYGYTASADISVTEIRMLRITDIQNNQVDWPTVPGCQIEQVEAEKYLLSENDILIARTGGTIGKSFIVPEAPVKSVFASYLIRITPPSSMEARYLKIFLESPLYWMQLREMSAGTGQPNVNGQALGRLEIPLPPLAEQKRIVAKVDELMALCDRLEAQQQERDTRHTALARASLARFSEAPTPANLDFLFHQSYAITPADLRKSILTLAVQGQLIKATEDASGWPAVRMRDVCLQITDGEHATPQRTSRGVPLATAKNVRDGFLDLTTTDWVAPSTAEKCWKRCKPRHDDLLMVCVGATTGRVCLVQNPPDIVLVRSVALIRPNPERISSTYLNLFLRSPAGQSQIWGNVKQSAQPCLYLGKMSEFEIMLPPLAEQRRIVAKVDQLMALVDQLENQLAESKAKSAALLEAIVHELLNPSAEVINLASYRAAIGCYTINKMSQQPYFGRTAAMKTLYLAEAHVGLHLGFQPEREAAGPFDHWIYRFEDEGKQKGWFKAIENTSNGKMKVEYQPGKLLAAQAAQAESQLAQVQRKEFDRLLDLLSDKKTEEVEIIATLFAAWNDFLIDGHAPSDDEIVTEVRENWHVKKERFTPALLRQWLGWLRQNNLVPQGRLPHTVHQSKLSLN